VAKIVVQMTSLGMGAEVCSGCGQPFARGELMKAVEAADGETLGWYCNKCIQEWRRETDENI